jgi:hypothetical protein
MSASDQHPPASTPPEPAESIPARPPTASRSLLAIIAGSGILIVLVTGAVVGLGNWLAGWHLTRPWLQLSATFVGMLLLAGVFVPTIARPRRIILGVGSLLLLCAVGDSLDRRQDILPLLVVLLTAWALMYADTTAQLFQSGRPTTARRWLAAGLGVVSTAVYLSVASYYFVINATTTPVSIENHLLYAFGAVILILLNWVGEIGPYSHSLTGPVRICASCGLRNIVERQTCKRCGTRLGSIEHVV